MRRALLQLRPPPRQPPQKQRGAEGAEGAQERPEKKSRRPMDTVGKAKRPVRRGPWRRHANPRPQDREHVAQVWHCRDGGPPDGMAKVLAFRSREEQQETGTSLNGTIRLAQFRAQSGIGNAKGPVFTGPSRMEARGIEPRSEPRSQTASTCVDYACLVSRSRREVSLRQDELLCFSRDAQKPHAAPARLIDVRAPPRAGRNANRCARKPYAAKANSELAVVLCPSCFSR